MAWNGLDAYYNPDYYGADGVFGGFFKRLSRQLTPEYARQLLTYGSAHEAMDLENLLDPFGNSVDSLNEYSSRSLGAGDAEILDAWNSLTDSERQELINAYKSEVEGQFELSKLFFGTDYEVNTSKMHSDIQTMLNALAEKPQAPNYAQIWEDSKARAYAERDEALAELQNIYDKRVDMFNDELQSMASGYNSARASVLSNQYQQNAQLMDNMTSQMDRTRRNALEAGASAGLRLAGNINTLLSTQNQQSRQSLETANQLAQMMVNQRNAEASVRGQYGDYLNQNFTQSQNIKNAADDRAAMYNQQESSMAQKTYDQSYSDWQNKYGSNPAYKYAARWTPNEQPKNTKSGG